MTPKSSGTSSGPSALSTEAALPFRPCIRGLRIRVSDVLDLLAAGLSAEKVIEELPDLELEDVSASLRYASSRLDHPVLAA